MNSPGVIITNFSSPDIENEIDQIPDWIEVIANYLYFKKFPSDAFPDDYTGWMFTGINALNKLDDTYEWYMTDTTGFYNNDPIGKSTSPFKGYWSCDMMRLNGKKLFGGIVFRKRPNGE